MPGLAIAADWLEERNLQPGQLSFVQVPHHGSRRNVGPTILNRLLGPKGPQDSVGCAFVSAAAKGAPKHPSKKVMNAFRRRGYPVVATPDGSKWHRIDAPDRADYSPVEPLPFYHQVEDDEG